MPYAASTDSPPLQVTPLDPVEGIPIPLDGLLTSLSEQEQRPKKRSGSGLEDDGRPHKGPRLNNDTAFSRYGDGMGGGTMPGMGWVAYGGGQVMHPFGMPTNGRRQQGYQPPDHKRGICRDYHSTFFW
jgi:RNA-binding protein 26